MLQVLGFLDVIKSYVHASPPRQTYPLVSAKALLPPKPDYPASVHLIVDYVDRDLEAKVIQLGREITHFKSQTGQYERQYRLLFVHDPRDVCFWWICTTPCLC